MKVSVDLFGSARDFSSKNCINFELVKNSSIKDLRPVDAVAAMHSLAPAYAPVAR